MSSVRTPATTFGGNQHVARPERFQRGRYSFGLLWAAPAKRRLSGAQNRAMKIDDLVQATKVYA